ncbi:glycosyltransferase family 2 protein [Fibrobacter succinogenes]|uniref:Glycosyl transferase family 2 n=1 Tax=Fibrobacter succinogenes TaxID=833 RepID=A0A380RWI7_FIBSU|nr:glycosyltransferase [Fibrobacter succinogenes]PWJ36994.1 glycosyl transferase family 2 [Fibrobacter succinogenes subsp. elongatus]SUQ19242.1 Glycosyl transferase family 2 [Fibrobacter succinogenes]
MISIIVPVYNTENFVCECIKSLLSQTYTDIEIIIVDDGSSDKSLNICREFEKKDSRIKVYHKENSGVSDTRNYGIKLANGDYISFCDSDDIVDPKLYQMLWDTMNKFQVDRVVSGYAYLFDDGHTLYNKPRVADGRYEASFILKKMIDDGSLSGFLFSGVNNSLFKTKIIKENNIEFDSKIRYNEDSLFSLKYMLASNAIYSLQSKSTYFYRQHNSSATKTRLVGDRYEKLRSSLRNLHLENLDIDFDIQMKRRIVTEALWQILDVSKKENRTEAIRDIRKIIIKKDLRNCLNEIKFKELNIYKKYYYILIKLKMTWLLYISTSKLFPILTKYLSR